MNKITCFQGKTVFLQKTKKHKILRRVEGQQPQNTRAGFYLLSLWSPHGHVSSSYTLFIAKMSLILFFFSFGILFFVFLVVVFRFVFPFLSLLCSLFLLFIFLHFLCVTKKTRSNHRISEMFTLIFCCRACILAFSLGPAKNPYSDQRTTPQNGIWFIFVVLNNVLKYLFLHCFVNINQNFSQSKRALKKMITFHNV